MAIVLVEGFEVGLRDWNDIGSGNTVVPYLPYNPNWSSLADSISVLNTNYAAQTFTVSSGGMDLGAIGLQLRKSGAVGYDLEIALQGVDGSNHPDGTDIATTSIPESAVTTSNAWCYAWFSENLSLAASTMYALVFRCPSATTQWYVIRRSTSSITGSAQYEYSSDSGSNWTGMSTSDLCAVYGGRGGGKRNYYFVGTNGYIYKTLANPFYRASFQFYIRFLPQSTTIGIYRMTDGSSNIIAEVQLSTAGQLSLNCPGGTGDTGSTLVQGHIYRISVGVDASNNVTVYLDGVSDMTGSSGYADATMIFLGNMGGSSNFGCSFDDLILDNTESTDDLGNLLVAGIQPNGEGTDDDNYTTYGADGWANTTEAADATYDVMYANDVQNANPDTATYDISYGGTGTFRYSVTMENCSTALMPAGATVVGVQFSWYYRTDGGGADDYGIRIRCSDDAGSPYTDDNIDDPKVATWLDEYHSDTPAGANAWTQTYVDSLEMGMATISCGGKELWWYHAFAQVVYQPATATTHSCDGTASGTATVTGSLLAQHTHSLAGNASATATITGDADILTELQGSVTASVSTTGVLAKLHALQGSISAAATTIGDATVFKNMNGSIVATVTTTGDADILTKLQGSVSAVATTTGSLGQTISLAGSVSATATPSGAAKIALAYDLSSDFWKARTATTHSLTGSVAATSTTAGVLKKSHALSGSVGATVTVTGDADIERGLVGSATVIATPSGSLSVLTTLAGTVSAESPAVTAELTIETTEIAMDGTVSAVVTTTGDLDVLTELQGSVTSAATVTGIAELSKGLQGSVTSAATVTGDVGIDKSLAGTISATASLSPSYLDVGTQLAGNAAATATPTGLMKVDFALIGTVSAEATVSGSLQGTVPLAGSIVATSTTSGDADIITGLQGSITATITSEGALTVPTAIYSRGNVLQSDESDEGTPFTEQDYTDVGSDDSVRVDQTGDTNPAVFVFKDKHGSEDTIDVTWNGQSSKAPSDTPVILQIWNYTDTQWETLDTESLAGADTDFDLTGQVSANLDKYYDPNSWTTFRVYQAG